MSIRSLAPALLLSLAATVPTSGQSTEKAVFIVNNVSDEITSYVFHDDGSVTFVGNYATTDGPLNIDVTPNGQYLAVTHGTVNDQFELITFFEVNADATLSHIGTDQVPNAPLGVAWASNEVVAVTHTDFGGLNEVITYSVDFGTGAITQIDAENTGGFCTTVIRDPQAEHLFANDSGSIYRLFMYEINPDGSLTQVDVENTGVYPLNPAISPDGTKIYSGGGISSDGHRIAGTGVDGDAGLVTLPGSPFFSAGNSPAYPAVSADGQFLFVGHGSDATVHSFTIAPDGSISPVGFSYDIGLQGTIGDIECIDDFVLITDESTAIDGIRGLYVFQINPNGTFTQVGPVHDSGGVRPEAMVLWSPAACVGDLDGDGNTDQADLGLLLSSYGVDVGGDLDGDGDTDQADLGLLLSDYGCTS